MAKFVKGQSGNTKGKPKGTKSEKVLFWDQMKDWFIEDGAERFKTELVKLEGRDFVQAYSNALEYFQPKLSRAQVEANTNNIHTFKVEFEGEDQQGL